VFSIECVLYRVCCLDASPIENTYIWNVFYIFVFYSMCSECVFYRMCSVQGVLVRRDLVECQKRPSTVSEET
jgi:hypothetical protein